MAKLLNKLSFCIILLAFFHNSYAQRVLDNDEKLETNKNLSVSSAFENDLYFDQFCENFKLINVFSKLATIMKRADEEFGLPAYLNYTSYQPVGGTPAFRDKGNQIALIQFTLNQMEEIYNNSPFTAIDFERKLDASVSKCVNNLKQNKDYRLFVLLGYFETESDNGSNFKKWLLLENNYKKHQTLFDARTEYTEYRLMMHKRNLEAIEKNASNNNQRTKRLNGYLFNEKLILPTVETKTQHSFDGEARTAIKWNTKARYITLMTESEGIKLAIAALVVKNGVDAISETYGKNLAAHIDLIDNKITRFRAETTKQKIIQIANDEKNRISDVNFNFKELSLKMNRNELLKLLPNIKRSFIDTIETKDVSTYACGIVIQQSPTHCNFTFAGEVITGIEVKFWGERVLHIMMTYGLHQPNNVAVAANTIALIEINKRIGKALDLKYPKESNTSGNGSNAGNAWKSSTGWMVLRYVTTERTWHSASLWLLDSPYSNELIDAQRRVSAVKDNNDKLKHNKKTLSDM